MVLLYTLIGPAVPGEPGRVDGGGHLTITILALLYTLIGPAAPGEPGRVDGGGALADLLEGGGVARVDLPVRLARCFC